MKIYYILIISELLRGGKYLVKKTKSSFLSVIRVINIWQDHQ